jgi:hypothetical protein
MKMKLMCLILLALSVVYPLSVIAADDWPASECLTNGTFDKEKCSQKAGWIAVGSIKDIHLLSYPKAKPLSEFALQVTKWEKGNGKIKSKKQVKYLEGYFAQTPQLGTMIRVYGIQRVKHLPEKEYGVLYIEKLNETK